VIEYHRGVVTVIDRPKLETLSCECYEVVKKECDRLLYDLTDAKTLLSKKRVPDVFNQTLAN